MTSKTTFLDPAIVYRNYKLNLIEVECQKALSSKFVLSGHLFEDSRLYVLTEWRSGCSPGYQPG